MCGSVPIDSPDSQWGTQAFRAYPTYISPNVRLQPAAVLALGLPAWSKPIPDLRPEAANDTVADLVDITRRRPLFTDVDFQLERQLSASLVTTVRLVYSDGQNLLVGNQAGNPNAIPLDALKYRDQLNDEQFNRSLRPIRSTKASTSTARGRRAQPAAGARSAWKSALPTVFT